MTDDHDRYREWAGAYVLGALEPAERADFERHLRSCAACQDEVGGFAAFPGLLAQVDPAPEDGRAASVRVTELAVARAGGEYRRVERASRRWRLAAIAAAAAAVVVGGIAVVGAMRDDPQPDRGAELAFEAEATGSVHIDGRPWGTWIWLDLAGLPARDTYQLWAIGDDGSWVSAATWTATPEGLARLTGAAALDRDRVDRLVITSADRNDVLLSAQA